MKLYRIVLGLLILEMAFFEEVRQDSSFSNEEVGSSPRALKKLHKLKQLKLDILNHLIDTDNSPRKDEVINKHKVYEKYQCIASDLQIDEDKDNIEQNGNLEKTKKSEEDVYEVHGETNTDIHIGNSTPHISIHENGQIKQTKEDKVNIKSEKETGWDNNDKFIDDTSSRNDDSLYIKENVNDTVDPDIKLNEEKMKKTTVSFLGTESNNETETTHKYLLTNAPTYETNTSEPTDTLILQNNSNERKRDRKKKANRKEQELKSELQNQKLPEKQEIITPREQSISYLQSSGISSITQKIFKRDESENNANPEGGSTGTFYSIFDKTRSDYPWACTCDTYELGLYKEEKKKTVVCAHMRDASLQNERLKCNPLNNSCQIFVSYLILLFVSIFLSIL